MVFSLLHPRGDKNLSGDLSLGVALDQWRNNCLTSQTKLVTFHHQLAETVLLHIMIDERSLKVSYCLEGLLELKLSLQTLSGTHV